MDLDKDILVKGNKVYSPDTCVFVPHSINGLFTGCNKGRNKRKYPLGVYYDSGKKKYRANMNLDSENIKFSERNTPEEAFEDYKRHKEALILVTADKYKKYIPSKVYHAMLNWKVEITDWLWKRLERHEIEWWGIELNKKWGIRLAKKEKKKIKVNVVYGKKTLVDCMKNIIRAHYE